MTIEQVKDRLLGIGRITNEHDGYSKLFRAVAPDGTTAEFPYNVLPKEALRHAHEYLVRHGATGIREMFVYDNIL